MAKEKEYLRKHHLSLFWKAFHMSSTCFSFHRHFKDEHNLRPANLRENFTVLKKCQNKLECLIFEMLFLKKKRPKLNTQADFIRAKLFVKYALIVFHNSNVFFHTFISVYKYMIFMLIFFIFDSDDMKSSKRHATFLSLIFLLKCFSKSTTIEDIGN